MSSSIENMIPHRAPHLTVKQVLYIDSKKASSEIAFDVSIVNRDTYIPTGLLVEACLQTCGLVCSHFSSVGKVRVVGLKGVKIASSAQNSSDFYCDVKLLSRVGNSFFYECSIKKGSEVALTIKEAAVMVFDEGD